MTHNPAILITAGEALFGDSWRAPLARELDVSERTLRRWTNGQHHVPDAIWGELAAICERRGIVLVGLAKALGRG